MNYIIKRNGNIVPFDRNKIVQAINKAFIEVDGQVYEDDTSNSIADELTKLVQLKDAGVLTEEEFQAQKAKLLQ